MTNVIRIGNSDLYVSRVGLGTWEIGGPPFFTEHIDMSTAFRTIDAAIESGINFIDTAPIYGLGYSEQVLGRYLTERRCRQKVVLATKCGTFWVNLDNGAIKTFTDNSAEAITNEIEASLQRLRTDYVDLYQIHWPELFKKTPLEETVAVLSKLVEQGKIRYYGLSNFFGDELKHFLEIGEPISLQNRYSLLMYGEQIEERALCKKKIISFLAYSPLHRGLLTEEFETLLETKTDPVIVKIGEESEYFERLKVARRLSKYAKQTGMDLQTLALLYMLACERVDVAIVGTRNPNHATILSTLNNNSLALTDLITIKRVLEGDANA